MLPPFYSIDLLYLLIKLELRPRVWHQLGWRGKGTFSVFLLGKAHVATSALLITTVRGWHFTLRMLLIFGNAGSMTENEVEYRFVTVCESELKTSEFYCLGSYSRSCLVTWGKLLHFTVSQFSLLWHGEIRAPESKYFGRSFKEVMCVKFSVSTPKYYYFYNNNWITLLHEMI